MRLTTKTGRRLIVEQLPAAIRDHPATSAAAAQYEGAVGTLRRVQGEQEQLGRERVEAERSDRQTIVQAIGARKPCPLPPHPRSGAAA